MTKQGRVVKMEKNSMSREEAVTRLNNIANNQDDIEQDHSDADLILCMVLRDYGLDDVVEAWGRIKKWYA